MEDFLTVRMYAHEDVFESGLCTQVDSAFPASAQSTNNEHTRIVASLCLAFLNSSFDILDQCSLVLKCRDAWKRLVFAVLELPCPGEQSESSTCEAGVL